MATPRPLPPRSVRGTEDARLADGFVVRASVVARVLGIRLLTLDARVAVAPTPPEVDAPPVLGASARRLEPGHPAIPRSRPGAIGSELAAAIRMIGEGEGSVAAARRNGGA